MAIDNTVVGDEADLWTDEEEREELDDQEFVEQEEETNLAVSMEDRLAKLITLPDRVAALESLTMDFDAVAKAEADRMKSEEFRELMEATANIVVPDVGMSVVTELDAGTGLEAIDGLRSTIVQKLKDLWRWLVQIFQNVKDFLLNRVKRTRKRLSYVKLLLKTNRVGGKSGMVQYPASIVELAKSTNLANNPAWVVSNMKEGLDFFGNIKTGYNGMKNQLGDVASADSREAMLSLVATTTDNFRQILKAEEVANVPGQYRTALLPGNRIAVISTGKTYDDYDFLITHAALRVPPGIAKQSVKVDRALVDQVVTMADTVMKDIERDFQSMETLTNEFKRAISEQERKLDERSRTNMESVACFAWYARIQKRTVNSSLQYLLRLTNAGLDFAAAALR